MSIESKVFQAIIRSEIHSKEDAELYLRCLFETDTLYHPEDNAEDIIIASPCPSSGGPTQYVEFFTEKEAKLLNKRMDEVWDYLDDPCGYILETFYPENL